jgi:RNA polymerase sigma-B factor
MTSGVAPVDTAARFLELRRTGDRRVRNELIEAHRGLAHHLARRYANRGEPFDDLLQVALLGMLKAVERFDPDRGVEFASFAAATIEGELKRHFRDRTWSVHVPRGVQELHLRLSGASELLSQRLGRAPTLAELAHELAAREDDVLEAMEAGAAYRTASLDAPGPSGDGRGLFERWLSQEDESFEAAERRETVAALVEQLAEREQRIVREYFFGGRTQAEIGADLGISQMHVSRLLARALARLRVLLEVDERAP